MKFLYVHSRDANGVRLAKSSVTLAVERRESDGRVLVAMVKCRNKKCLMSLVVATQRTPNSAQGTTQS